MGEFGKKKKEKLPRWRVISRARRGIRKLESKFTKLGELQFLLYQTSIHIGKLRAICSDKEQTLGSVLCALLAVIGGFCVILPLRVSYTFVVVMAFMAKPVSALIRKRRTNTDEPGSMSKKIKSAYDAVQPDIPKVQVPKQ